MKLKTNDGKAKNGIAFSEVNINFKFHDFTTIFTEKKTEPEIASFENV